MCPYSEEGGFAALRDALTESKFDDVDARRLGGVCTLCTCCNLSANPRRSKPKLKAGLVRGRGTTLAR